MYHCFRLRRGQDLYEEIEAYVKAHHIAAGAVVSGVGCVSRWRLRDATGVRVRSGEEDVEIVSLMGTVSEYGPPSRQLQPGGPLRLRRPPAAGVHGEHHGRDRTGRNPELRVHPPAGQRDRL